MKIDNTRNKKVLEQNALILCKALSGIPSIIQAQKVFEKEQFAFLQGRRSEFITNGKLSKDPYFGIFSHYSYQEIRKVIVFSETEKLIKIIDGRIEITEYGKACKKADQIVEQFKVKQRKAILTENEEEIVSTYSDFFAPLNTAQKKAVSSLAKHIFCIAGAGSGKTTVLTKRIVHLVQHKKVNPHKILAITFTKKAKEHMQQKLESEGITGVHINTFNSFGEKHLQKNPYVIYSKKTTLISYKEKVDAVLKGLAMQKISFEEVLKQYFGKLEFQRKNVRELLRSFVNDCFAIKDYFNNNNVLMPEFYKKIQSGRVEAEIMHTTVRFIITYMRNRGLRDFSDQLTDVIELFKKDKKTIPVYEHILIDEYQDINTVQKEMIDLLQPKNIFVVGDPRQSIYGWRGAKIEFIQQTKAAEVIHLTKNYRCAKEIVDLANKTIETMHLPDLISEKNYTAKITFTQYSNREEEAIEVARKIRDSNEHASNVFIISRTNKQLECIAEFLERFNIPYYIKRDETELQLGNDFGKVTLATVHAVKGLESKVVYIIGCTRQMFPCVKSEHKIMEYIKEYYNKKEEELRLLYVAITRAEEELHISYYGKNCSLFLPKNELLQLSKDVQKIILGNKEESANLFSIKECTKVMQKLFELRERLAEKQKLPKYLIYSEAMIKQMACLKIITQKNLAQILGSSKMNRYGDAIMKELMRGD